MSLLISIAMLSTTSAQEGGLKTSQTGSGFVYGPGLELLTFDSEPDENGLVWQIHEPNRDFESWAVTVYNGSESIYSNINVTLEYMIDGQWYLLDLDAHERTLYPFTVGPGEVAFAETGSIGAAPPDWTDTRIILNSIDQGESTFGVNLTVQDIEPNSRGGYTGSVVNNSPYDVTNVTYSIACVDQSGRILDSFSNFSDIRVLDAGATEPFEFSDANGACESGTEYLMTANARIRA